MSCQNLLQRTLPIYTIDPKLMFWCVSIRSGAFWIVSLLHETWCKSGKLVQLMQKFIPRCRARIFRNECSRCTPLDPKIMFWCVSFRSGAFWTVLLLPGFTFPTGLAKPEESGSGIPVRFGRLPVRTGQIQI